MSDISGIDSRIVDMYLKGYSIKSIVDYVFKYSNRNVPKNYSFGNSFVVNKKKYSRLDCDFYVSRVILNYNRYRHYIV